LAEVKKERGMCEPEKYEVIRFDQSCGSVRCHRLRGGSSLIDLFVQLLSLEYEGELDCWAGGVLECLKT